MLPQRLNGFQVVQLRRIRHAVRLRSLSSRNRRIARLLARGEATSSVARMFGLSWARISQLRRELQMSWRIMQGELSVA